MVPEGSSAVAATPAADPGRPGFAPPHRPLDEVRGSGLHRRMLALAGPRRRGFWRLHRDRYFDRFRRRKLGWILTRAHAPLRLLNFATYLLERGRRTRIHYTPPVVNVELINVCNLRCPGCPTGRSSPGERPRGRAGLAAVKERIDRTHRRALQLQLFQLGEPLLHPDFFEACAHGERRGLWTVAHSNLSVRIEDLGARLVSSGLHQLVVSCDGATQETYGRYRVRGDVEQVFRNLREIAAARRRRGGHAPWLTAKFLVFDHNWHEMEAFRERALGAGADEVLFIPGFCNGVYETGHISSELEFDLRELRWLPRRLDPGCRQLWETISFDVDGAVMPCCDAYRDEDVFVAPEEAQRREGDAPWNHPSFLAARAFLAGRRSVAREDLPRPCDTCGRTGPVPDAPGWGWRSTRPD